MYGPCTESESQTEVVLLEAYCNNLARCVVCSGSCAEIRPLRTTGPMTVTARSLEAAMARMASERNMPKANHVGGNGRV